MVKMKCRNWRQAGRVDIDIGLILLLNWFCQSIIQDGFPLHLAWTQEELVCNHVLRRFTVAIVSGTLSLKEFLILGSFVLYIEVS